jgi:uncharacterized protein
MIRPLIIYHDNCMDGFSAAWCFWRKYHDQAQYLGGRFYTPPPDVTGREVYLVDFCYERDDVAQMLRTAASVTLIDHHKTALENVSTLPGLQQYTDLERSGATLAWDYLYPDTARPLLLEFIEDRDLWRRQLKDGDEISACLHSYEFGFELWDQLMALDQAGVTQMKAEGTTLLRKQRKDMAVLLQVSQRRMVIAGHDVPVANIPFMMASEAGHQMAKGEPFSACYWDTAMGRKFELRSVESGLDVSAIARTYGGGGHVHAAGFRVARTHELAMC